MKNKNKIIKLVILLVLAFVLLVPKSYAFYFSKYESLINSILSINESQSESYIRATVLTYWIDTNHCTNENDYTNS